MRYLKQFESYGDEEIPFSDLEGNHILSGVDRGSIKVNDYYGYEDAAILRFVLDGKTYKAIEDPQDGYRSSFGSLIECNEKVENMFIPHEVIGRIINSSEYGSANILAFYDVSTKDVVLEMGTDNSDDYYPSCVMSFHPENLEINRAMSKYNL